MCCFLGEEQRMHINYMQSKISVIRAIRVQKKAYMLSLGRRTTNAYNYMQSKISVICNSCSKKKSAFVEDHKSTSQSQG